MLYYLNPEKNGVLRILQTTVLCSLPPPTHALANLLMTEIHNHILDIGTMWRMHNIMEALAFTNLQHL
jgi:hypothetical protein